MHSAGNILADGARQTTRTAVLWLVAAILARRAGEFGRRLTRAPLLALLLPLLPLQSLLPPPGRALRTDLALRAGGTLHHQQDGQQQEDTHGTIYDLKILTPYSGKHI